MNDPTGKKCLQKLSKQTKAFDLAISLSILTMAEKHRDLEGVNPTEFQALLVPVPCYLPFDRGFGWWLRSLSMCILLQLLLSFPSYTT